MKPRFRPIASQNPVYLEAADDELYKKVLAEHGGTSFAELKEDGYRLQIHKRAGYVAAFTRQGNAVNLGQFPELARSLAALPACILDTELRGGDGIEGFNHVKRRFRNHITDEKLADYLASGVVEEHPISLVVFDTLAWEGRRLLTTSLENRRRRTESIDEKMIMPSEQYAFTNHEQLGRLFERVVDTGGEGLVCKKPGSRYVPGSRTSDWIKIKRAETLDLAIIGLNTDAGDGGITQIMCGAYNPATKNYEALVSVNARKDAQHEELAHLLERAMSEPAKNTVYGKKLPRLYVSPTQLVEVAAMNIMRGKNDYACGRNDDDGKSYSLRIGWLKRLRDDKAVTAATTVDDVARMYATQADAQRNKDT